MWVCKHVLKDMHENMYICMWMLAVDVGYFPPFLATLFFERGSFTEPGIGMARQAPEICLFQHPITGNIRYILPQADYEWT